MSWLNTIFQAASGGLIDRVGRVVDELHMSGEEKARFQIEIEGLLQKRDSEIESSIRSELRAKERVLMAELTQGYSYTKRARPTVVYMGLALIFINYCIIPSIQSFTDVPVKPFQLPTEFWAGWTGIVATWSIGRSMEKRGIRNRATTFLTGNRTLYEENAIG